MDSENFDLVEMPPDRLLFHGQLYHKQNSKLKKLKVNLKQSYTSEPSKVFSLDIRGVNHKYHFQIDFTGQELCFLRFEEIQDNVHETSCLACLDRNFYPTVVYSRLLMLLYSDPDNGEEARCIKIPFIQRGNMHSSNTLRKLNDVIYSSIVSAEELKNWQVYVVRCGEMLEGEKVYLCLTKNALIVVLNYHILHYHNYFSSRIEVTCVPEDNQIVFTVYDKAWVSDTSVTENFSLFKTYIFKTVQCQNIEKSFLTLMRKSLSSPYGPSAHFNIRHSEMSASAVPGTTSDNVMIIPHRSGWHDNNNSGSTSDSNGHLPSGKIDNLVTLHDPQPHRLDTQLPVHRTASSNGSIPGSGNSSAFGLIAQEMQSDDTEFSKLQKRGCQGDVDLNALQKPDPPASLPLNKESQTFRKEVDGSLETPTPTQHTIPKTVGDSDPGFLGSAILPSGRHKKAITGGRSDDFSPEELGFDNLCYYPEHEDPLPKFATSDEVDSLPLPPPCTAFSQPFAEFSYKPKVLPPTFEKLMDEDFHVPERQPLRGLLRSRSSLNLNEDIFTHMYVNISQEMSSRNSVHDDFQYYRFYYNIGLVRVMFARMSKKLKRRDRLSKGMKEIDWNKLESHEQWYDRDFKVRSKDLKFCNLHNIPSTESNKVEYDYQKLEGEDDPYWTHNDLCFTIQQILEESPKEHKLLQEVQSTLDITAEQLIQMQVLLSLVPAENNWKVLAEYIGLNSGDISIIEHFCYTYRVLPSDVVLTQWMLRDRHQFSEQVQRPSTPPFEWDSLVQFLDRHDRNDIAAILRSRRENEHILESTQF